MSIPFSNTTLRVPRGFGNLLEGLAREVLRNQPKDIPTFAALYFSALLKEREESGLDPAEWGAKLEDRFYNNHAFKQETEKKADVSSEPQREAVETVPENSAADTPGYVEQEVIQPVHISTVSSANFDVLDDVPGVESWGEGGTGGKASEDICAAELAPSPVAPYGGVADVDICAEGLRVPGGLGEFDLTTVVGTPTPLPTPLPGPEEVPTAGSPGSVLLDFRDDEAGQMQDAIPGNAVEETPPRTDTAEQVRGEAPETPEAVLEHGEGQEENEEAAEIDDATKSDLHLKGGNKSGTELQTGEEDPPLGRASPGEEDPPLGRASPGEEDPPLRRASPGEEVPPLERALGSAREEGNTEEHNDPESIQPQKTCTEEAKATNRDTPPQNSAGMTNTSDDKADDHEDNSKEEAKIDALVADAESDEFLVGDVQAESKEDVSISAEQQVAKESEPGKDVGSVGMEQGIESEEQEQDIESEEQEQVKESEEQGQGKDSEEQEQVKESEVQEQGKDSEEQKQGIESEKQRQGKESEEQEQSKESEEQRQGKESEDQEQGRESEEQRQGKDSEEQEQVKESEVQEQGKDSEEQKQGKDSEEQKQGIESEEQEQGKESEEQRQGKESEDQEQGRESEEQVKNSEDFNQGAESEEQTQGEVLKEQAQNSESEEQTQGEVLKEQAQNSESEEQTQGEVLEEQAQDAELEEQTQGAELEEQVPAVIPEVNMDEREPKEEREDLLQNMDKRNHSDEQEAAQQEEEKVPVGEEGDHKEECSQPQEEEDVMDIPLDDPEANKAAAKIQAGFRGHMTRKKMKDDKPREEVSSSPDVLSGSQRDSEPAGSEGLARDDSSASEQ